MLSDKEASCLTDCVLEKGEEEAQMDK